MHSEERKEWQIEEATKRRIWQRYGVDVDGFHPVTGKSMKHHMLGPCDPYTGEPVYTETEKAWYEEFIKGSEEDKRRRAVPPKVHKVRRHSEGRKVGAPPGPTDSAAGAGVGGVESGVTGGRARLRLPRLE